MSQLALPLHNHKNGNSWRDRDLAVGLRRSIGDLNRRLAKFEPSTKQKEREL